MSFAGFGCFWNVDFGFGDFGFGDSGIADSGNSNFELFLDKVRFLVESHVLGIARAPVLRECSVGPSRF